MANKKNYINRRKKPNETTLILQETCFINVWVLPTFINCYHFTKGYL